MDDPKERLVAQFRAYLDASNSTFDSADADDPDLFSLMAELAALKNEVKLESKQIKQAYEQFRDLFDTLRLSNERLAAELERIQQDEEQIARMAERTLLLELLELRDRLNLGYDHASGYQPNWLARLAKADEFIAGMSRGLEMNLRRVDELLVRRDVYPIASLGRPFDPQTMTAVELSADRGRKQGEVVADVRIGYLQGEQLLRAAEVVVNNLKDRQVE